MFLQYELPNGEKHEVQLRKKTVTLGRGPHVDIYILDTLVSRLHCEISFKNNAYYLHDFKSKNGTFVNQKQINVVRLNPGDCIRIGKTIITAKTTSIKGTSTILKEITEEMQGGKGYHTILKEIVDEEKQL